MTRDLWERAEAVIEETRRLVEMRRHLLEQMTDIAVHRWIVAQDAGRCLQGAEQRLVEANAPAIRAGLASCPTTPSR